MFYYIFVFVLLSFFLLFRKRTGPAAYYSILAMACYTVALMVFILYISKDSYYYNAIDDLFSIPLPVWNKIMFLAIPTNLIIRLLNFSALATVYFSILFTFTWVEYRNRTCCTRIILCVFIAEFMFYDPSFCKWFYLKVYPALLDHPQYLILMNRIHVITASFNVAVILFGIWLFWQSYRKASPIRLIKISTAGIGICHALIMGSYILLFGYYPVCLVKISRVADIVSYITAPLIQGKWFTRLFPYYLLLSFLLICYSLYRTSQIRMQLEDRSFTIAKQISAADTTSKVFCHYLKNEILAIQSEVEILEPTAEQKEAFHEIEQRCRCLYERLDLLYKNSKASSLTLAENNVTELLNYLTEHFSYELQGVQVECQFPEKPLYAMLDETYFYQALHNIVSNALDAMRMLPASRQKLVLSLNSMDHWIYIHIADTGKGIAPENLSRIFTPFYSSYPIRTHWGIGLSLTYKIIEAHEGHIDIESQLDQGTTVKILLPQIIRQKQKIA